MSKEKYPKWIDELAKAFHNGLTNMTPCSWGPIDAYTVFSFLNGTFISKIYTAVNKVKEKGYSIKEIVKCFPSISSLRPAVFYFLLIEYQYAKLKNKQQFREIIEFFLEVLKQMAGKDIFAHESNIIHTDEEIKDILDKTEWQTGNREAARELGKLYTSLVSLVFALYRDFFPQDSNEIYGPYDVSEKFGDNAILIIKHFPKIKPVEIWPEIKKLKYSDVKIFQVFKNVKFKCELVGMHSIYEGDLINNLVAYSVLVDSKYQNTLEKIRELSDYFAKAATKYSLFCDNLSKEELKKKVLEWECYQFFIFFKLAEMDWRPTKEMLEAIKDKEVADRFELEKFPPFEEYIKSPEFEIYWLKDLYK